ncbi:MAG: DUF4349 domain-containing protein [Saccharofermentanales bacterium]|nr:DUF4349 domain-containing protein [Clostridiaceae bacterium]
MKRLMIFLLCLTLSALIFAGCASSSYPIKDGSNAQAPSNVAPPLDSKGSPREDFTETPAGALAIQRKVVKNASLTLEAVNVSDAYAAILRYVEDLGGYEFSRSQQVREDITTIYAVIKINPEQLDTVISHIGTLCRIVNTQTSSNDITADYYDAKTRLATMEKALATYYNFLESAENIEESLLVQQQINELTVKIESLKGQINMWDSILAESTLDITLRQLSDPVQTRREISWSTLSFDDMGYLIKTGLNWLLNTVAVVLQWLAIILAILSPLLIVAAIVLVLIFRRRRRKRILLEKSQQTHPADPNQGREN